MNASAPSISVALCTYNGERYLQEQLESMVQQSRPADEIVIRDDGSSDRTNAVIDDFVRQNPGVARRLTSNGNVGSTKNFELCFQQCSGDVVVFSDQDDMWHVDKLNHLTAPFEDPQVGLVFSDARLVDESGRPFPFSLWDSIHLGPRQQEIIQSPSAFSFLLHRFVVTGAVMAVRRDVALHAVPFSEHLIHDIWLGLTISALARCVTIPERLIDYRQHDRNQIGARKITLWRQFQHARQMDEAFFQSQQDAFEELQSRLTLLEPQWISEGIGKQIAEKVEHGRRRLDLRRQSRIRRLPTLVNESIAGRYQRCSSGWRSIAQDLLL